MKTPDGPLFSGLLVDCLDGRVAHLREHGVEIKVDPRHDYVFAFLGRILDKVLKTLGSEDRGEGRARDQRQDAGTFPDKALGWLARDERTLPEDPANRKGGRRLYNRFIRFIRKSRRPSSTENLGRAP